MTHANTAETQHYPVAEKIMAYTHTVENQPPVLENYNQYSQDLALVEAVHREGASWVEARLAEFGATTGSREKIDWGIAANVNKPTFCSHNQYGQRVDEVTFHPAYHQLMSDSKAQELHSLPWIETKPGANVVRAATGASRTGSPVPYHHDTRLYSYIEEAAQYCTTVAGENS